jgi:prepilin-type N-terminal cleavage/methylation domain-containing protein
MKVVMKRSFGRKRREDGFSMIEMVVVVAIGLVLSAMAIPQIKNAMDSFKLRNATVELSGLVQQARSRSVQDNKQYPVYFDTSVSGTIRAFVDVPISGTIDTTKDPIVSWGPEITPQTAAAAASALGTAALKTAFLGSNASLATVYDGSSSSSPVTFTPMGVPCSVVSSVCNSWSNPIAYWIFLKDARNSQWEAITITPAGKIQKWTYANSTWSAI